MDVEGQSIFPIDVSRIVVKHALFFGTLMTDMGSS